MVSLLRALSVVGALLLPHPARAVPLEAEGEIGAAVSNLPGLSAFAVGARVAADPVDHFSLGLRGFLVLGDGPDSGATAQFRGWAALAEARVHTGEWLAPVRIHLGAAAGLGREVAAAKPEPESHSFEATATGPTVAASLGARIRAGSIFVGVELSPFYWAGHVTTAGSGSPNPNGALGALFVLSLGYAG